MEIKPKEREYEVTIHFKSNTVQEGVEELKAALILAGMKVIRVKNKTGIRSKNQNNALHRWFSQIAEEAERQKLTIDLWIRHPTEMYITENLLKDSFRLMANVMYKKNSTAILSKQEFSDVVRLFDKAVLERLGINIPFPSLDLLINSDNN